MMERAWGLAIALLFASSPVLAAPEEASDGWLRVSHPVVPISLEVPRETDLWVAPTFSFVRHYSKDGRRQDLLLFGLRPIGEWPRRRHAIEIGFLWVTPRSRGVDAGAIPRLLEDLDRPGVTTGFLRTVLYAGLPRVRLTDRGPLPIGRNPARRIGVTWRAVAGTRHERTIHGELVVVPVHPAAILVVLGRFEAEATADERAAFARIVQSVRFEDAVEL